MWRCVNNFFAYCNVEPSWEERPHELGECKCLVGGRGCADYRHNPKECSHYVLLSELLASVEVPKGTYKHVRKAKARKEG